MRLQRETLLRLEEPNEVRRQCVLVALGCQQRVEAGEAVFASGVDRLEVDRAALAWSDLAGRLNIDRHVDGHRSGMKEVQRPEIDGGSGKIGATRRLGINLVWSP